MVALQPVAKKSKAEEAKEAKKTEVVYTYTPVTPGMKKGAQIRVFSCLIVYSYGRVWFN